MSRDIPSLWLLFFCEEIKRVPVMYRKEMEMDTSAQTVFKGPVYECWPQCAFLLTNGIVLLALFLVGLLRLVAAPGSFFTLSSTPICAKEQVKCPRPDQALGSYGHGCGRPMTNQDPLPWRAALSLEREADFFWELDLR